MAAGLASLNVAASNAASAASNQTSISADSLWWPAWVLVAGVLIALGVAVVLLQQIKTWLTEKPKSRAREFAEMMCHQVWRQTDQVTGAFAQRLRQQPGDVVALRVLVRNLREDLSAPINFVEQMRRYPPEAFPKYDLFNAFNHWSGQIAAFESQLSDLQRSLTYPIVREEPDKHRDDMLVFLFLTERQIFAQGIENVSRYAADVCAAAKPHLKKKAKSDDEDEHDACPCCSRRSDHGAAKIELIPLPPTPPPQPKKKEEKKEPAVVCCCAAPRQCHCTAPCVCMCCCPASADKKAAAAAH